MNLRSFYARRALRLAPALILLLGGCSIYAAAFEPAGMRFGFRAIALASLYVSNFVLIVDGSLGLGMLTHTWSLAIEEQFYTIWPLALLGLLKLPRRATLTIVAALAIAAALFRAWCFASAETELKIAVAAYSLPARADALLAGALVALIACWGWLPSSDRGQKLLRWSAYCAALVLGLLLARGPGSDAALFYGAYAAAALATGILIAGMVAAPPRWLAAFLAWRPVAGIGRISYGLYLFHVPVFCLTPLVTLTFVPKSVAFVIPAAIAFAATFALASLSFYLIERRCLALKGSLPRLAWTESRRGLVTARRR